MNVHLTRKSVNRLVDILFSIRIRFNMEGARTIDERLAKMPHAIPKIVQAIALAGEGEMKRLATLPGKYRSMLEAWRVNAQTWRVGATGAASKYAPYLNYGTNPSRGRYIPQYKKRFSKAFLDAHPAPSVRPPEAWIGMHPGNKRVVGQKGLQFFEGGVQYMADNAVHIGEDIVKRLLQTGGV